MRQIKMSRLQIKTKIKCFILLLALIVLAPPLDCTEKHWIHSKSIDGSVIILEDGSVWEVDPPDRIDSSLWLPTDEVIIYDDREMINLDSGEKVNVMRLR